MVVCPTLESTSLWVYFVLENESESSPGQELLAQVTAVSPRGLVGSLGAARTDLLVSSLCGPEVAQYSPGLGVVVVGLAVVVQILRHLTDLNNQHQLQVTNRNTTGVN